MNLLHRTLYGNTLADWSIALAIAAGLALLFYFLQLFLVRRLVARSKITANRLYSIVADIFSRSHFLFLLALAVYAGSQYLELPPKPERLMTHIGIIALLVQGALWGNHGIALWLSDHLNRHRETDAAGATTVAVLGFIARVVLWSVLLLLILENLGFNITTLLASLGIGGIAAALAVQNILGDIFASLSIALDKPFVIGDFIVVDEVMGTVEFIGLKTTRLRSLSGEQIIFSNTDLLKSRIRNHKRMYERRVVFSFGVTYQTTHDKLERIPAMIREIIATQSKTRFDRTHFKEYGDSYLKFEAVYFVEDPDYNLYMDIQQAINLAIFERFQQEVIALAYPMPTQNVSHVIT